jgi:hypothetical protein
MLDHKIEVELQEKREKMAEMERELDALKDLKQLKSDSARRSDELGQQKETAKQR